MMEAQAQVISLTLGSARVRMVDNPGGCGRCDEPGGCRSMKLTHAFGAPTQEFDLPNSIGARPGDQVLVRIRDGAPLRGALASYGLGAALLVAGAAAGHMLAGPGGEDGAALLGAIAGLAVAMGLNRLLYRSRGWRSAFAIELVPLRPLCQHSQTDTE